jgi:DNA-binding transcriptional regulator LsrR (DeoR family)
MKEAFRRIENYLENHTQRDLASKLDVSEVTVSRWLSSRKIHPAYVKLIKERIK